MTSLFTPIGMGFDFIVIVSLLHLAAASSLSLDMEYLFLLGSSAPINGCSAASCDFGALAGEDKCIFFCCTVFNWRLLISFY